jgi:preprotein translocase subunit SecG
LNLQLLKEFPMLTLLAYVHIVIGFSLILFVLLQDPKGGAMGVFSGGSSANSFFGSSGASNFLTSTTKWLAVLFAASCLTLTYLTAKKGSSVMDTLPGATTTQPKTTPDNSGPTTPPANTAPGDLPGTHTGTDYDNAPHEKVATPPANSGTTPEPKKQ